MEKYMATQGAISHYNRRLTLLRILAANELVCICIGTITITIIATCKRADGRTRIA